MTLADTFRRHLQRPDVSAEELALDIACVGGPALDLPAQFARIVLLAQLAAARVAALHV